MSSKSYATLDNYCSLLLLFFLLYVVLFPFRVISFLLAVTAFIHSLFQTVLKCISMGVAYERTQLVQFSGKTKILGDSFPYILPSVDRVT